MLLKSGLLWERFVRCSTHVLCIFSRYRAIHQYQNNKITICGYYDTFVTRYKEIWEDLCRGHIGSDEKLLYGIFCHNLSALFHCHTSIIWIYLSIIWDYISVIWELLSQFSCIATYIQLLWVSLFHIEI